MYFNEKGNTDINDNLKFESGKKFDIKKYIPYAIFLAIFILGIVLIVIGSKMG